MKFVARCKIFIDDIPFRYKKSRKGTKTMRRNLNVIGFIAGYMFRLL